MILPSNARIAGMEEDLELHGQRYQWLLNIFYISYIVFEFQALMWKILPPNIWAAFVVFGWGIAATLQSTTKVWATEMVCRWFLGLFEAGFGPGIPYLLSFFYLRHELGLRIGIFLSAAPLATTFAGALAYGITSGHSHLANWRLLFLVEGLPTILMAAVAYRFLPASPDKARFLTHEETLVAKARGVRQVGDVERIGGIVWRDIGAVLIDPKAWFTAFMYFSTNVGFASLPGKRDRDVVATDPA
ncbi:MAG: hypothetical protein L6R37_005043 [Teloschistes peruensis]|nr:MAG: hypothetical protein L6R37_005043 [Teloschistes peruensis]